MREQIQDVISLINMSMIHDCPFADFSSSKARALRNKMGADETYVMPKQDIDDFFR